MAGSAKLIKDGRVLAHVDSRDGWTNVGMDKWYFDNIDNIFPIDDISHINPLALTEQAESVAKDWQAQLVYDGDLLPDPSPEGATE